MTAAVTFYILEKSKLMRIVFSLLVISCLSALAQKVEIEEKAMKSFGLERNGFATTLALEDKFVEKAWVKKLKEFGKVERDKNEYKVNLAEVPSVSNAQVTIYSYVLPSSGGVMVWYAIDKGSGYVNEENKKEFDAAVKILHDFGVERYVADINEQIKEAEDALRDVVKDQEKVVNKGSKLATDLEENKEHKIELLQELKSNKADSIVLEKEISFNLKEQDKMKQEVEKMKIALDNVKAKLDEVE